MTEHSLIQTLRHNLRPSPPPADGADAAVLIPILGGREPEVLLTRRAAHMKSHAGEVAFPGGKREPGDLHLAMTALRESEEEVALPMHSVEVIGALKPARAKSGILVLPVVGVVDGEPDLVGNPDEIESVFRVPLRYFIETPAARDHRINFRGIDLVVPCFRYEGYVIWGLTAYMLVDFIRHGLEHHIDYPWPPALPGMLVPGAR
ncbi:CoA pyrophosphatase [Amnimonas aquatica]|uniref:CoA pyrophosphatase n=1 Tax=Amnimonas aquatica TaxID=2094561 RepID=A0A2P6ARP8_9GAMM|nr:CoA pyrophosphatase [Amnimonas aquatica]PQA38740.1 CoA pyrophosphatase [Amnimonas aquatica]